MSDLRQRILDALAGITDPVSGRDLVGADLIRALMIDDDGRTSFVIEIADPANGPAMEPARAAAVAAVERIVGARRVSALVTAHSAPRPPDLKFGGHPKPQAAPIHLPGVGRIIAIGSGKGGVGKSTVSANLAAALTRAGKRVGLLDADFYGPSQPRMLGATGRPASPDGKTIQPMMRHGIAMMSIGLMMQENEAVVWRGPMLMGAMQQMLGQVAWGDLDILIIDLPPGTGDVQIMLAQKSEIDGAIIVSTPQDIALLDARRAISMFEKVGTPVLGLIENMSVYVCPNCGHEAHLFGHGGARAEAERRGLPFLGEVPLRLGIRTASDNGTPVVLADPESAEARAFADIAQQMIRLGIV